MLDITKHPIASTLPTTVPELVDDGQYNEALELVNLEIKRIEDILKPHWYVQINHDPDYTSDIMDSYEPIFDQLWDLKREILTYIHYIL